MYECISTALSEETTAAAQIKTLCPTKRQTLSTEEPESIPLEAATTTTMAAEAAVAAAAASVQAITCIINVSHRNSGSF